MRLIGSLEERTRRIMKAQNIDASAARHFISQEDRGRERYLRTYFNKDINDPLLYHMVVNTDLMPPEQVARMIGEAVTALKPEPKEAVGFSS